MKVNLVKTEDGSDTLYAPELDESYHSIHGAIQESKHVFINQGLKNYLNTNETSKIDILEYGFGTGLNALLTALDSQNKVGVEFTSLEKYPIDNKLAFKLNYGQVLNGQDTFDKIISCEWETWQPITNKFNLRKLEVDFLDYRPESKFNIIYFDAFAPSKQPDLWSIELLSVCYECLNKAGVFVTYSAKGQLRRDLQSLGFKVERLPGPPGKYEMLRAVK